MIFYMRFCQLENAQPILLGQRAGNIAQYFLKCQTTEDEQKVSSNTYYLSVVASSSTLLVINKLILVPVYFKPRREMHFFWVGGLHNLYA